MADGLRALTHLLPTAGHPQKLSIGQRGGVRLPAGRRASAACTSTCPRLNPAGCPLSSMSTVRLTPSKPAPATSRNLCKGLTTSFAAASAKTCARLLGFVGKSSFPPVERCHAGSQHSTAQSFSSFWLSGSSPQILSWPLLNPEVGKSSRCAFLPKENIIFT